MTFRTLIRRNLRFHWRSHLGVVLGAAIGSAALIGALVVGDSVKGSLRERAASRFGRVHISMATKDRFFETRLFDRMLKAATNDSAKAYRSPSSSPTLVWGMHWTWTGSVGLHLPGSVTRQDGNARANSVHSYGMDARFFAFNMPSFNVAPGTVVLNEALARQLGASVGDRLVFRVQKPSALSGEVSFSKRDDANVALPLVVANTLSEPPGDLSFNVESTSVLNAFIRIEDIQSAITHDGKANLLLADYSYEARPINLKDRFRIFTYQLKTMGNPFAGGAGGNIAEQANDTNTLVLLESYLRDNWTLNDVGAQLLLATNEQKVELRTERIFLDPPIACSALAADTNAQPLLTYLATLLCAGTNATPYSMVTAAGAPWTPADLRDDEIVVSQWLAEDLHMKPGDEIALSYFLPESGAKLIEATNTFRVRSIVPPEMPWMDRTLMPDFPGIEKAESTSEWDAGFPLTYKIRPKDEEYWKKYRGTPKAFITPAAGQKLWGNRFGDLTAIRFPIPSNSVGTSSTSSQTSSARNGDVVERVPTSVEEYRAALEKKILANLKPEELGLRFEPVREQAIKAAEESQDFGGLFLGFSFFVIAAALLLMALLFSLGLEQRAPEIGTLLALGFTPKQVRKLLLREAVVLSLIGGVIGALGGLAYAKAMLHGLTTVWRDAVGATALNFHFTAQTLAIGIFASTVVSMITIWLALRKFVKRPARELLIGEIGNEQSKAQRPKSRVVAVGALLLGMALVGWAVVTGETANAGIFFGAGALVLVAGLGFAGAWLAGSETGAPISFASLALRGCARRRKRSLATIAMLACGSFLIVSIGVFRLDANRDAAKRTSSTGGFALIGETTMPVVHDLNTKSGREFFALNEADLAGVHVVSFRVRAGDEASCLNLNAAQRPKLLGVKPEMLDGRFGFQKGHGWKTLKPAIQNPKSEYEVPAIGDANSIQWAMHKKVGDTIDYVDERGQPFKVRIVGAVANSILQGQLIIDEAEFVKRFPGESGYRMFLMDAPSNAVTQVSATLSRAMQDVGLELTPAVQRLNQFNAVQNTYLGTFLVLGGLGLLLGSVGLGVVVLRNVLERRGELAVLLAVGFRKPQVQRLLLLENGALLAVGLAVGVVAAAVAVLPAMLSASAQLPYGSLALTLAAVLLNGALWTWAATRFAVRGDLLAALRNE